MMRRRSALPLLAAGLCLALAGCGSAPAAQPSDSAAASTTADATATTLPDDANADQYAQVGTGEAYVVSSDGSTRDGDLLKLGVNPSNRTAEVSAVTEDVNQKTPLYVYVDGTLAVKEDVAEAGEPLTLKGSQVADGEHSVTFVQYDNGQPTGTVTFYRVARYSVG